MNNNLTPLIEQLSSLQSEYLQDDIDFFTGLAVTFHSNQIEDSKLNYEKTAFVLDNPSLFSKNTNDVAMAKDHNSALMDILKRADNKLPLDVEYIKHVSSLLLKNTGKEYYNEKIRRSFDSSKGEFRLIPCMAGGTTFSNYEKIPELLQNVLDSLNTIIDKDLYKTIEERLKLSFDLHYNIVQIHPFIDGNGRLSRLMMNYVQRYYKLPLSYINIEDKEEYVKSLVVSNKRKDISIFHNFMFKSVEKSYLEQIHKLDTRFFVSNNNKLFPIIYIV